VCPMATVRCWTGAETEALRQAMRLSIRAFAAHLGVDARTVNKWEARGNTITLLPDTQALMDTALGRAPEDVKTRFTQTLDSSGQQPTNRTEREVADALPRSEAVPVAPMPPVRSVIGSAHWPGNCISISGGCSPRPGTLTRPELSLTRLLRSG
jgi:transcriptional regulator with XRE-family HTH domain